MTSASLTTDCRLLCACTCAYDILDDGTFKPVPPHYPAVGWTAGPTPYFAGPENVNACLIGTNQDDGVILAFRGTLPPTNLDVLPQLRDWLQDFFAEPVAQPRILPPTVHVHRGFWDALDTLWPQIVPALRTLLAATPKLYITGHSKGGAMAAIAAARLFFQENISAAGVYLYAPARTGDSKFVSAFPSTVPVVRYEHYLDVVPFLPPSLHFIDLAGALPVLGDLFRQARGWDYTSLGVLRYIEGDGAVVNDSPGLQSIRLGEILGAVALARWVDVGRAHGPWCRAALSDGGYMLGVCPPSLCASPA